MNEEEIKRYKPHDCSALMTKVMRALDGEMTEKEEKEFLDDINQCSHCLENYNIEKSFKEFLSNKLERKTISASVIQHIKDKIHSSEFK